MIGTRKIIFASFTKITAIALRKKNAAIIKINENKIDFKRFISSVPFIFKFEILQSFGINGQDIIQFAFFCTILEKNMKYRYIFALIFLLLSYQQNLFSQDIVVSEIYNSGELSEWTELLVIKDHLDLRGYSIRDNNTDGNNWQVPATFGNHDLWSDLREGTVILLWHRPNAKVVTDLNINDGYIEICIMNNSLSGTNEPYFTATDQIAFANASMNLNQFHEIVQIRNASDQHVHCLGYMTNQSAEFVNISGPKLAHAASVNHQAVTIVPGTDINSYTGGFNSVKTFLNSQEYATFGTANVAGTSLPQNHVYWRKLRQPEWANYGVDNFRASISANGIELTWNPRSTETFDYQGYLIVRGPEGEIDKFKPTDGMIYNSSEPIPETSVKIVAYIPGFHNNSYSDDNSKLDCETKYHYRIFLYRYNLSDFNATGIKGIDVVPEKGRGRSYNEDDYAESNQIYKNAPEKPVIKLENTESFCAGKDVLVSSNIKNSQNDLHTYWFVNSQNGHEIADSTKESITIKKLSGPTTVSLKIVNDYGCEAVSDPITINAVPYPDVYLQNEDTFERYYADVTLDICGGEENIRLSAQISNQLENTWIWYKDGVKFAENTVEEIITEAGKYQVVSWNKNLCEDSSAVVTVEYKQPDFDVTPNPLVFTVSNEMKVLTIRNNSNKTIEFLQTDVIISGNFELITGFPIAITQNSFYDLNVKFIGTETGTSSGSVIFKGECNSEKVVELIGIIEDNSITKLLSIPSIDFGDLLYCDNHRDTTFAVTISGTKQVVIDSARFNKLPSSFIITEPTSIPHTFSGNGNSYDIHLNFSSSSAGLYNNILTFYYTSGGNHYDSLEVRLKANVVIPELVVIDTDFEIEILSCENYIDTVMKVYNPGVFPDTVYYDDLYNKNALQGKFELLQSITIVNPGDTVKIPVRIYVGDRSYNLVFMPCTTTSKPVFKAKVVQTDAAPEKSQDYFSFGIINSCENSEEIELQLIITSKTDGMRIESLKGFLSGAFETDLKENVILQRGENTFNVVFKNDTDGIFTDSLKIMIQPCDNEFTIYASAQRYTPIEPTISTQDIDFGDYLLGSSAITRTFSITNNDNDILILEDLFGIEEPFNLVSHTATDFPLPIPSGETIEFTYEFSTDTEDNYADELEIIFDSPCNFNSQIQFTGTSIYQIPTIILNAFLPDSLSGEPGDRVDLPIRWSSADEVDLSTTNITKLELYLSYDEVVFFPNKGYIESATFPNISEFLFEEYDFGKAKMAYKVANSSAFKPTYFGIIEGLVLLGDTNYTYINLDSVIIESPTHNFIVNTNRSLLSVDGITRYSIVNDTLSLKAYISDENSIKIEFFVPSNDRTSIKVFDALGRELEELINDNLNPGEHSIDFSIAKYSIGPIYIMMQTGSFTTIDKVVIIR